MPMPGTKAAITSTTHVKWTVKPTNADTNSDVTAYDDILLPTQFYLHETSLYIIIYEH